MLIWETFKTNCRGKKQAASQHGYDNIVFGRQNYMEMGEKKYCKIKIWGKIK